MNVLMIVFLIIHIANSHVLSNSSDKENIAINNTIQRIIDNSNFTQTKGVPKPPPKECYQTEQCISWFDSGGFCDDGICECRNGTCWTYSYYVQGLFSYYVYYCGVCGELGSECNDDIQCHEPGICSPDDHYCHCPEGEIRGGICFVTKDSYFTEILLGGFLICFLFGLAVTLFNAYQGYRLYGTWCWCRYVGVGVRVRQTPRSIGPEKSPAYTIEPQPVRGDSLEPQDSENPIEYQNEEINNSGGAFSSEDVVEAGSPFAGIHSPLSEANVEDHNSDGSDSWMKQAKEALAINPQTKGNTVDEIQLSTLATDVRSTYDDPI